ncbi:Ectopic P granules protein 5 homolog, partial [Geodia barretti]
MKSCLSAVVMKTQSQIGRQSRTSDDEDRGGGGGPQVEREREYLLNTLSFFQTLNLWLEEPRLHDASLYLPGLPQQYNSQRLATIFSPPEFCFWMEFVPVSEVKVRRAVLIDEWLQVESYQKTLASHTPKPPRDDAMTRIRKRLDKGKQPVAPPTLQVGPAPFEHLTEEIMLSQDSLLVFLKSDIQFVVQQASSHSTKANVLVTLDTQYMDGLPVLYSNQPRQFMVSVPCKRSSSRCAGPATIVFRYEEIELSPKWEQMLKVNRSEYEQLVASLSLPLSLDFCKAVVRMEHTVSELSRMAEQLPETERSKAVQSGVNLFYEILTSLNLDCRQFPPSCQFLTSCVQILGQEFIQKDPSQTVKILDCLIKQPSKADLLAPLFHPNNSPAHFLEMYSNVETVAREEGPNVAFSVLTKFNVQDWLDGYSSSLVDRSTFLHQIWRGILLCGPRPSLEFEILLEVKTSLHSPAIVICIQDGWLACPSLHLLA